MSSRVADLHATTSLLRHAPPGEEAHFDWFVVLDGRRHGIDERTVPCLRLRDRLDLAGCGSTLEGRSLPPHRGLYLDLETPRELAGCRGLVEPLRRGDVLSVRAEGGDVVVDLRWRPIAISAPIVPERIMRVRLSGSIGGPNEPVQLAVEEVTPSSECHGAVEANSDATRNEDHP